VEPRQRAAARAAAGTARQARDLRRELDDGSWLLLHLGMTGQLFSSAVTSPRLLRASARGILAPEVQSRFTPDEHTHLRLHFRDAGPEIFLRDARKFGKVLWLAAGAHSGGSTGSASTRSKRPERRCSRRRAAAARRSRRCCSIRR
jgi:formamidopyrimidine-DNA glycosylase